MHGTPRITALINTHNYARYVGEAIDSVLAQNVPPDEMEVLVVDDGSTDDTAAVVARFGERVRYVRKENGGQASALNVGFAEARGEIIAMLDGDDVWRANKLRRVLEEFSAHPEAGMVYHPYTVWEPERGVEKDTPNFTAERGFLPEQPLALLRYGSTGTCGMVVRRAAVEPLLPIPAALRIYADTYLVLLLPLVTPVAGIAECLTKYRHHGDNWTAFAARDVERMRRRWQCHKIAYEEALAWLRRRNYDLTRPAVAAFVKRYELVERMFQFEIEGATRGEYFRYLREYQQLYAPLWSSRYRLFRTAMSVAGWLLGYARFERLRDTYRGSEALLNAREAAFPTR
jgi:glycosyltransferase involved in cell wall biosynthesis